MNTQKMKKFITTVGIVSALTSSIGTWAKDTKLKLDQRRPDVILQMNFNQYSKNFFVNLIKETLSEIKGVDIFNTELILPEFDPYIHEKGINDYVVGDLGAALSEVFSGQIAGASTTFDIYELKYKIGKPRLIIDVIKANGDSLDVKLKVQITKLDIGVDAIYVNNHSPGVKVHRSKDNPTWVENPELMTILDDIYLKVDNPEDRPMLKLDGGKARRNDPLSVLSGEIDIKIIPLADGTLQFKYQDFKVNLFGAETGEDLAPYIDLELGDDTKIGGLEAVEFGRANLAVHRLKLAEMVKNKKQEIANLLSQPIIDQVFNEDIKKMVEEKINKIAFNPNIEKRIDDMGIGIKTKVNEFGIQNQINSDDDPQLRFSLNVDVNSDINKENFSPVYKPVSAEDYKKSQEFIYNQINDDKHSMIVSIDQEFVNRSLQKAMGHKYTELIKDNVPNYVSVGQHGMFAIFDDLNQGKLVIDLFAREKFFKRVATAIATGRSKFYFPLVMVPEVKLEVNEEKVPEIVINIKDIDMSEETLRHGIYGIDSNLNKGWLKKMVLKMVKNEMSPAVGSEIYRIPLPQLKGLNIDEVLKVQTDGHGRLNVMLDISPLHQESRKFNYMLPEVLGKLIKPQVENVDIPLQ